MSTLNDFIHATASYFGIPLEQVLEGSALDGTRGEIEVVLRVALTPDDLEGVVGRLVAWRATATAEAAQREQEQQAQPTQEVLRVHWEQMTDAGRARWGSFHRYALSAQVMETVLQPKVELPEHAYIPPHDATEQQKAMAVGRDARGWFAVDPADLTPAQRVAYVLKGEQP